MSWMTKLYETYEQAVNQGTGESLPLPVGYINGNVHINIVLNENGEFKRASVFNQKIIFPATETSAGRSGTKPPPHPLADKLRYVAKDYLDYGGKKYYFFTGYKKILQDWCESPHNHPKVIAVYQYIQKGNVLNDLIRSKIVYVNENNELLSHWTYEEDRPELFKSLKNVEQDDAMVCWSIEIGSDPLSNTWEDRSLHESWAQFLLSQEKNTKGFCFVTGEMQSMANNHPRNLRRPGDGAKLVSSNDNDGFTFRGRFLDKLETVGIGTEVTQKVHSALRWLIEKQGYLNKDQVIIAWAISGSSIPNPLEDPIDWFDEPASSEDEISRSIDHSNNLGQQFAHNLRKKLAGYKSKLQAHETISIMALDSASPGRMSITYYRELNATEFFDNLESWYSDFSWPQQYWSANNTHGWREISPIPLEIVKAAYGERVNTSLVKKTIEQLLFCIQDRAAFPKVLVDACVRNASNPNSPMYRNKHGKYEKSLHDNSIGVTCALFKGYTARNIKNQTGEQYQMSLEKERRSRDYLYGRLLAVSEQIERHALKQSNENRITSAERLMQRFSSRPFSTWKIIDESLRPYKNRLRVSSGGLLNYWERQLQEICDLFEPEDFLKDKPLTGEYLLGYFCQKNYRKPEEINVETNTKELCYESE